jgi:hypothetical protein
MTAMAKRKRVKKSKARPTRRSKKPRRIIVEHATRQGAGRHSALTDPKARKIIEALRRGCHDDIACEYAGVPARTFYDWIARGEKELERILSVEQATDGAVKPLPSEKPFLQFSQSIKLARSGAELSAVKSVERAWRKGDWHAAIAFVERRHRGRWHRMIEADIAVGPLAPSVTVTLPHNFRADLALLGDVAHQETETECVLRIVEEVERLQQRNLAANGHDCDDRRRWFSQLMSVAKARIDAARAEAKTDDSDDDD